jgi:hypothetical protein
MIGATLTDEKLKNCCSYFDDGGGGSERGDCYRCCYYCHAALQLDALHL